MIKILFVCAGNTCRSVMAEYISKNIVTELGLMNKFDIRSCGICVNNTQTASFNTIEVIKIFNQDVSKHNAQSITKKLIQDSNYICAMDQLVLLYLREQHGLKVSNNIFCISKEGINDPYGMSVKYYEICRDNIKACLEIIIPKIIKYEKL